MISLIFIALFAVIVGISAIVGLVRGLNKSVVRLITLAVAVLLTFLIAGPITNAIVDSIRIEGLTIVEMLEESLQGDPTVSGIFATVPMLWEAVLVIPAFVLSIAVFPVVFGLLRFVTWIVFLFVQKPLRKLIFKDPCEKGANAEEPKGVRVGKRFAGLGIGIVSGMIIFGMLLTPFLGVLSVLPNSASINQTMDALVAQGMIADLDAQTVKELYAGTDNGLLKFYGTMGSSAAGKAYLNSVSKIQANGQSSSLANELSSLMAAVQASLDGGLLNLLQAAEDPEALYALLADKDALDGVLQQLFQSQLLVSAVPEVVAMAMEGVASGLNVPANKEAVYDNMMDNIAQAVKDADIDYEGMKAYEDANSITYRFARSTAAAAPAAQAQIMTEAEYQAQLEKLVQLSAQISGILNSAIAGDNADFANSVADQIVNEVKMQAATNGQAVVETFDAAGVQQALAAVDTSEMEVSNADQLLEQLTDKEKFETDVATVESITAGIQESLMAAVGDKETAAQTATTLANVISSLSDVVSSATTEDGSFDPSKLDYDKLAGAVTELQNSPLKGVGSSLLDVVASGDLGQESIVGDVLGAIKEGYDNGEDIGGTISTVGALVNLGTAMGSGEANQEVLVDSLTSLINNLNEFTISLLPAILSDDTIASMGIPAEYAKAAMNVIETLLKELMNLKGAEDYTNEVNSIQSLYNVITQGAGTFTPEDLMDLVEYAKNSDAIFNTLVSISGSNPFGVTYPDAASRDAMIQIIRDGYAQTQKTQKDQQICNAIASLVGLGDALNLG